MPKVPQRSIVLESDSHLRRRGLPRSTLALPREIQSCRCSLRVAVILQPLQRPAVQPENSCAEDCGAATTRCLPQPRKPQQPQKYAIARQPPWHRFGSGVSPLGQVVLIMQGVVELMMFINTSVPSRWDNVKVAPVAFAYAPAALIARLRAARPRSAAMESQL